MFRHKNAVTCSEAAFRETGSLWLEIEKTESLFYPKARLPSLNFQQCFDAETEREPRSPDVVVFAEDHPSFAVAGAAVLAQLSVAAGALEAARVPVLLHGEKQEAVRNSTSASRARATRRSPHDGHRGHLRPAVHHRNWRGTREMQSGEYEILKFMRTPHNSEKNFFKKWIAIHA